MVAFSLTIRARTGHVVLVGTLELRSSGQHAMPCWYRACPECQVFMLHIIAHATLSWVLLLPPVA